MFELEGPKPAGVIIIIIIIIIIFFDDRLTIAINYKT